jgi:hypothetical protein
MTKDEALHLAYEALEHEAQRGNDNAYQYERDAIKAALEAKDEQQLANEPVIVDLATMELAESVGLIGPASRTHDLHNAIQRFHDLICANATIKAAVAFSCTLEAKDEPVAYINVEQRKLEWAKYISWDTPTVVNLPKIPLYTTPQQRTWVGLTDEEVDQFHNWKDCTWSTNELVRYVEAKLKEKNT